MPASLACLCIRTAGISNPDNRLLTSTKPTIVLCRTLNTSSLYFLDQWQTGAVLKRCSWSKETVSHNQFKVTFYFFFFLWQPSFNFTLPVTMGKEIVNKTKQQTNIFLQIGTQNSPDLSQSQ